MNTSLIKLLACSLLAYCCLPMRSVPARDLAPLPAAPSAAAATAAPSDDEDNDARAPMTAEAKAHDSRKNADANSVVAVGHNAKLAEGERADTVVSVFGSSSSAGTVDDAVVSVFGNTRAT